MVVRLAIAFALLAAPVAGGDVRLHSDERANAGLVRFFLELPRTEHVAVIGDGESGLLEFESPLYQVIDSVGAVEKRVLGMTMEMNEGHTSN